MRENWKASCVALFVCAFAAGEPAREDTRRFFAAAGKQAAFRVYENIPRVAVRDFLEELRRSAPLEFLGAGVEGVVYRDRLGRAWKIALGVAHALGTLPLPDDHVALTRAQIERARSSWMGALPIFQDRAAFLLERAEQHWPMRSQTLTREIIGTAFWAAFAPGPTALPHFVTEDGLGYCRDAHEGVTLGDVLREAREGRPVYDMARLWQELATFQRSNEAMLARTGLAVDAFSSLNLLVVGPFATPRIVPIDSGLSLPQASALPWLAARGIHPPKNAFAAELGSFTTPLVATPLVVSSKLWGFDYEQAVAYVGTYFGVKTRAESVRALASVPMLVNERYPALFDHGHIERARAESGGGCGVEVAESP